jgi:hypothetical protein
MAALTAKQISDLNRMNRAAQNATLGTRLNALEVGEPTQAQVIKYSTTPVLGTAVYCHAAIALLVTQQDHTTITAQPDVPRILSVKGNDGNVTGNVVITGTNYANATVTDTIALSGSSEVFGVVAFKTITNIHLPVYAVAGTETVSIGIGDSIGLPIAVLNSALVVLHSFNNANDAGSVVLDATVGKSVYDVAGTLNGVKILLLYVLQ